MRLIDIEELVIAGQYQEIDAETYIRVSDVEKCIDRTCTAYDVEAVVRELENEFEWSADTFHGTKQMDSLGEMRAYDNAIRIVKRGGRNELQQL